MLKFLVAGPILLYLLAAAALYFNQRKLLYFPTSAVQHGLLVEDLQVGENKLEVMVLNPGKSRAIIYFGGNAEVVSQNAELFEASLAQYSVYLLSYRGYGASDGSPSERALFADALALYDSVVGRHQTVGVIGRSLGTGVGVYLASQRNVERMLLVTPYDSIAAVAQSHYPYFPVRYLIQDQFDSLSRAPVLDLNVGVLLAEHDQVIPAAHSDALLAALTQVKVWTLEGTDHNSVAEHHDYALQLRSFFN